ncbi:TolC family protein [Nitrospira moscoviensis]|uniref:Heavy metal efflux pump protein CzcC n=1 Tax=Nitrospira moscoviensis TaxID=42253 RepID=A0A0K2GIZ0_NITMO|nr:TolC family protein [Nitrospira moscoviensis]ALA60602.1 heavy metal efflux pump protein CzcC [Nitrospira moscoviensis]
MTWSTRFWLLTIMVVSLAFWTGERHIAYAVDQTPRSSLGLPDLIQEALARNPEIVAARQQWEAALQRITQARSLDDPTLSVQLWNVPQTFNVTQAQNSIFGLSQNLPFPGKLALKGDVASRSAEMTEQALRAKERELVARLKQAYYDLFLTHKAIQIHHEQVELLGQFVESTTAKFRTGKGAQTDVLKAQIELSLLFQQLPILEQRRETAEAMLNTLLDRDATSPLGIPQEPSQIPLDKTLDDLHRLALHERPELKAAELAVQRNEQSRALAQRQYYPDFNVAFQRFQNFQTNDGFGAYVAMSIPFALWTKPKYDAGVQEAAAALSAARAQHHTLENLTRFQVKDLLTRLRATDQVTTLYRTTILPQVEQSLDAARVGYRAGRAGFLDLIEAQRVWRGSQLEYFKALVDRQHRLAELEQVVGITLDRQS